MNPRKLPTAEPDPRARAQRELKLLVEVLGAGPFREGLAARQTTSR